MQRSPGPWMAPHAILAVTGCQSRPFNTAKLAKSVPDGPLSAYHLEIVNTETETCYGIEAAAFFCGTRFAIVDPHSAKSSADEQSYSRTGERE
jgi:hypothetical protein